ncbi:hypothetical protein PAERUG_E16_London_17_VIM_2_04_14_06333 [Pseudomonas aeruginosa]|nr:hypothetical protein PAERUG_E16_London_17_VIM_2_04_14_06333 [Pseudomonas aeruginosa]
MPRWVASSSGKKAAIATNVSLAGSPRPNQAVSSGTQAKIATCRSAAKVGPKKRSAGRHRPSSRPPRKPRPPPSRSPPIVRFRLSNRAPGRLPSSAPLQVARATSRGLARIAGSTHSALLADCHRSSSASGGSHTCRRCQPRPGGRRRNSPVAACGQCSRRRSSHWMARSMPTPTRPMMRMQTNTMSSMNSCRPCTIR